MYWFGGIEWHATSDYDIHLFVEFYVANHHTHRVAIIGRGGNGLVLKMVISDPLQHGKVFNIDVMGTSARMLGGNHMQSTMVISMNCRWSVLW